MGENVNPYLAGAAAATSLVLAWRWRRHYATWKLEDFLAAALVPLALISTLLLFFKTPFRGTASEAPSVFAYAPSRLLPTPQASTIAAGFMAGAFLLATLVWAHRRSGAYRPPFVILGSLLSYLALFSLSGTVNLATTIHAHAPTAGFGMLACVCLFRRGEEGPPGGVALLFSGLFASLSVLSAAVAAPLPVALAAHLWFAWGRKISLRYLLFLAGAGGALTLTLFLLGGNLSLPPWKANLVGAGEAFLRQGGPVLALLPLAIGLRARHTDQEGGRLRRDAATIPLLAGICLIPTSLIDVAGVPAATACFHALFYLVASASLLLTWSGGAGGDEPSRRVARGLLVLLAVAILYSAFGRVRDAWTTPTPPNPFSSRP